MLVCHIFFGIISGLGVKSDAPLRQQILLFVRVLLFFCFGVDVMDSASIFFGLLDFGNVSGLGVP